MCLKNFLYQSFKYLCLNDKSDKTHFKREGLRDREKRRKTKRQIDRKTERDRERQRETERD
jgi:hypothetical protein